MEKDLSHYRKAYGKSELVIVNCPKNPLELFKTWFTEVDTHFKDVEANAMTLATIGVDGYPKSRVVLLKKYSKTGFVFYTNYNSDKGIAISNNSKVCLSFFWEAGERQVIIKGNAAKVSAEESDAYFNSRPKGSQLGAIASNQSEVLKDRFTLEEKLEYLEIKYKNTIIERPEHWGGYNVIPVEIEFWQGRPNRLHDRVRYSLSDKSEWIIDRLSP